MKTPEELAEKIVIERIATAKNRNSGVKSISLEIAEKAIRARDAEWEAEKIGYLKRGREKDISKAVAEERKKWEEETIDQIKTNSEWNKLPIVTRDLLTWNTGRQEGINARNEEIRKAIDEYETHIVHYHDRRFHKTHWETLKQTLGVESAGKERDTISKPSFERIRQIGQVPTLRNIFQAEGDEVK